MYILSPCNPSERPPPPEGHAPSPPPAAPLFCRLRSRSGGDLYGAAFLGKYPGAGLALPHVAFFLLRPASKHLGNDSRYPPAKEQLRPPKKQKTCGLYVYLRQLRPRISTRTEGRISGRVFSSRRRARHAAHEGTRRAIERNKRNYTALTARPSESALCDPAAACGVTGGIIELPARASRRVGLVKPPRARAPKQSVQRD